MAYDTDRQLAENLKEVVPGFLPFYVQYSSVFVNLASWYMMRADSNGTIHAYS